jgi:MFS family permease
MSAVHEERGLARYRVFLAIPHTRSLITWSVIARLPVGMTPLALLFLARGEGESYAAAGVLVAAYGVALALGSVIAGRLVDRRGPARVLRLRAVVYPALLAAVIAFALLDAPFGLIVGVAAAAGFMIAPISATVRSVWPAIVPEELRSTAYSLEATVQEVIFVVGPMLAAVLSAIDPVIAVAAAGLTMAVGTLRVLSLPPVRGSGSAGVGGGLLGALESAAVRLLALYALTLGIGFGAVEVSMPAFAEGHGGRELGGLALAAFSAGSLAGGVIAGSLPGGDDRWRVLRFAPLLGLALLSIQLAGSIPTLCVLSFVAGLPIAPTVAAVYGLIDRTAPRYAVAEAFSWFGTSVAFGIAVGTAGGGLLVDHTGVRWSMAIGPAAALVGAGLLTLRRSALTRGDEAAAASFAGPISEVA